MRTGELLRLVGINISQNKFKTVMTSIGIVAGAATIVMVIAIGRGGRMDVAEQFAGLNAGAIDVTYEYEGTDVSSSGRGGFSFGSMMGGFTGMFGGSSAGSRTSGTGSSGGGTGSRTSGGSNSGNSAGSRTSGTGSSGDGTGSRTSGGSNSGNSAGSRPSGTGNAGSGENAGMVGQEGSSRNMENSPPGNTGVSGEERTGAESSQERSRPSGEERTGGEEQGNRPGASGSNGEEMAGAENEDGENSTEEETADLTADRMNQEKVQLSEDDADEIELFVTDIDGVTISYSVRTGVEGAELTESQSVTVAGVREEYFSLGNVFAAAGELFTQADDDTCQRVCVLGASLAKELFGNAQEAVGEKLYIDDRSFTIAGVLDSSQTVFAGISPDEVIFIPYQTGMKYIAGSDTDTTITVIAQDVDLVSKVEEQIQSVLGSIYPNTEFSFSDAGSKMEAAESSNRILTMLLTAMAVIVFLIGGIGIMNVLFVSVKERTGEIGVLKALGASRRVILSEFLAESAAISMIGGVLGVLISFAAEPVIEHYGIRVEPSTGAYLAALVFAVLTGTIFGFYPAWKASRMVPVDALNAE